MFLPRVRSPVDGLAGVGPWLALPLPLVFALWIVTLAAGCARGGASDDAGAGGPVSGDDASATSRDAGRVDGGTPSSVDGGGCTGACVDAASPVDAGDSPADSGATIDSGPPCAASTESICDDDLDDDCDGMRDCADPDCLGLTCDAPAEGAWSDCAYADACDEASTQMRTVNEFVCNASGSCAGAVREEQRDCTRDTDGMVCGSASGSCSALTTSCRIGVAIEQRCVDGACPAGGCTWNWRAGMSYGSECARCPGDPGNPMLCSSDGHCTYSIACRP